MIPVLNSEHYIIQTQVYHIINVRITGNKVNNQPGQAHWSVR